ncbi:MAG: hypothetical protein HAW67_00765 [Endozoicomonadaceae bacterium]|nr:hypothetical protein [Endozoicomonadaceae bacterium]
MNYELRLNNENDSFIRFNPASDFCKEAITFLRAQSFDQFHKFIDSSLVENSEIEYIAKWSCAQRLSVFFNEILKCNFDVDNSIEILCETALEHNNFNVLNLLLQQMSRKFVEQDFPTQLVTELCGQIPNDECSEIFSIVELIASKYADESVILGSALEDFVEHKHYEALHALLYKPNITFQDIDLTEALFRSVCMNDLNAAKLILISHKVVIHEDMLLEAIHDSDHEFVVLLHEHGADFEGDKEPVLIKASRRDVSPLTAIYILENHPLSDELIEVIISNATKINNYDVVDAIRSYQLNNMLDKSIKHVIEPNKSSELKSVNSL